MEIIPLKFEEAEPATYPELITYDEDGDECDLEIPARWAWRRIEEYIVQRWTPRQCVWTVRGPGEWQPHLGPLSNATVDIWDETTFTWSAVTPDQSPLGGFIFSKRSIYRITGTVGSTSDAVPSLVVEAHSRLKAYCDEVYTNSMPAGSSAYGEKLTEALTEDITRSPTWIARALQHSGCADLLRAYRRI